MITNTKDRHDEKTQRMIAEVTGGQYDAVNNTVWWPIEVSGDDKDHIPMARWGRDHWSTFAYLETCAVDQKGRVDNKRMRTDSRLHRGFVRRVFSGHYDNLGNRIFSDCSPPTKKKYPTRLVDGEQHDHDDWSCVEDMVAEGLIEAEYHERWPGEVFGHQEARVRFTERGMAVAQQIRQHKMQGGSISNFVPDMESLQEG